ncbi:hypothetical protein V6Z11_D01G143200 [Gossypium hirsutum]
MPFYQNRAPLFTLSSYNSKHQTPFRNCPLSPVEKPKAETPINENGLRIIVQGRMRNYISYAMTLLQEKGAKKIVLKATSRAINKTVMIAELIMVYGALHMTVKISLMWNSKMVIDGGEDTTVATSWLEARNLVAVPCIWLLLS